MKAHLSLSMSEAIKNSVRVCKFCRDVEKDGKVEMCRSVVTGEWVCMKCFNEKIRNG